MKTLHHSFRLLSSRPVHFLLLLMGLVFFLPAQSQIYTFAELQGAPVDTTGWHMTGSAAIGDVLSTNQSEIQLCSNQYGQSGAIFHTEPVDLNVCARWVSEFDFRMFDGDTADGIAFCFLDVPPAGFVLGGGLGVPNSANGLKVCFDTHLNCTLGADSTVPKIELRWGPGYNECAPGQPTLSNNTGALTFLRSPVYNHAKVIYDNGNISVYVNNVLYLTGFQQFNFVGYFGFTASTGVKRDMHSIKNVHIYTEKPASDAGPDVSICSGVPATLGTVNNPLYSYSWTSAANLSSTSVSNPTFLATNTTSSPITSIYYVTTAFTNGNGCTSKDTVEVTLLPGASVNVAASSTTVCNSTTVTFTATVTNAGTSPTLVWKINGVDQNFNGSVFSSSSLQNGDIVTCEVVNQYACGNSVSNPVTVTVQPNGAPSVSLTASSTSICPGTPVTFIAVPVNGGSAPSYAWFKNGQPVGSNSATYTDNALVNGDVITVSLTSNAPCMTPTQAQSAPVTITVTPDITPSISINASATGICAGIAVSFTATTVGAASSYQWYKNGQPVGSNAATYTDASLTDNDVITCSANFSGNCLLANAATSNAITMHVTTSMAPAITINANPSSICAGTPVNFTATVVNGGTTPVYQWLKNGNPVGSNSSTYMDNSLSSTDQISCVLTATGPCISPNTATSNVLSVTVNPVSAPSVSISSSNTSVCAGTPVSFTATATDAGAAPVYQWMVNGVQSGSNSSSFMLNNPANGDQVQLILNSNDACAAPAQASSNTIVLTVQAQVSPAISITASAQTICSGQAVNFTAVPGNAGTSPAYQWMVNGQAVSGATGSSFSSSALSNGDQVSCQLSVTGSCYTPSQVVSNVLQISVSPSVITALSLSASATDICAGTAVNLTAQATGPVSSYQWFVNGQAISNNGSTLNASNFVNDDQIQVLAHFSGGCLSQDSILSNVITMVVHGLESPAITITADASSICPGTPVNFTAQVVNGGTSPVFNWFVNGGAAGTGVSLSLNNLVNGDVIYATVTSNSACAAPAVATSNSITIQVVAAVQPSLSIQASQTVICQGIPVTFTATASGPSPVYQWKKNGQPAGQNSASYTDNNLVNGDQVSCEVSFSGNCLLVPNLVSNIIIIAVQSNITPTIQISVNNQTFCPGTPAVYSAMVQPAGVSGSIHWYLNGSPVNANGNSYTNNNPANGDQVYAKLNVSGSCLAVDSALSNTVVVQVGTAVAAVVSISANADTICAGTPIVFTATGSGTGTAPVYQWLKNGQPVGNGALSYTDTSLQNGDQISCTMVSSAACALPALATSNVIVPVVKPMYHPQVQITSNADTICAGTTVNFLAVQNLAVGNPSYQWFVNQAAVGNHSNQFSSAGLQNGDQIYCVVNYSGICNTGPAQSNPITVMVRPMVTPAVTLNASSNVICKGANVTFTAQPVNGGTSPLYTWSLNGNILPGNGPIYSATNLSDGDTVRVVMLANALCMTQPQAAGLPVSMTVFNLPVLDLPPSISFCEGDSVVLHAGSFISYLWQDGSTLPDLVVHQPGLYHVTVRDVKGCRNSDSTVVNALYPKPGGFLPGDTAICAYSGVRIKSLSNFNSYTWSNQTHLNYLDIKEAGTYWLQVMDAKGCKGMDTLVVAEKDCGAEVFVPDVFTPNGDGKNDSFRPIVRNRVEQYTFNVYNRWGELVFSTHDPSAAWDGRFRGVAQPSAVFVWTCNYAHPGAASRQLKGTVTLIR